MKKLLVLAAGIIVSFSVSSLRADDATQTVGITKAGDNTAKVTEWSGKDLSGTVPISFASGVSWDDVKDSYDVSPDTAAGLVSGKLAIVVNADSGLSYTPIGHKSKK